MLEDLLFAQLALKLHGQSRFLEFAGDRAVLAQKDGSSQLLGDGACPFPNRALADIGDDGPGNAPAIHTVVLIETSVFGGDESLSHRWRHRTGLHLLARCWPQLLDHLAIGGKQGDRSRPIEAGNPPCIWKSGIHQLCKSAHAQGSSHTHCSCCAGNQCPVQAGTLHITWVKGLWPTARAVTSMPSTRNGWALA